FQAEDGIRDRTVTGVQTCALPILRWRKSCKIYCSSFSILRKSLPVLVTQSSGKTITSSFARTPAFMHGEKTKAPAEANTCSRQRSEERRVGKEYRARECGESCKEK